MACPHLVLSRYLNELMRYIKWENLLSREIPLPNFIFSFLTILNSVTFTSCSVTGVNRHILELDSQTPNPTQFSRTNLANQFSKKIATLRRRQGSLPLESKKRVALLFQNHRLFFQNHKLLIFCFRKQQPLALFCFHFLLILRRENQRLHHSYLSLFLRDNSARKRRTRKS